MKKLIIVFSLITYLFSSSLVFSCESNSICCETTSNETSNCFICSPHIENQHDIKTIPHNFKLNPTCLGQIFFTLIHIKENKIATIVDRPPAPLS